jgi:uncharacterized protein YceK
MRKLFIVALLVILSGCGFASFKADAKDSRFSNESIDGMGLLLIDNETGCQYITTSNNAAYTPRLNSDGKPMCVKLSK